MKVCFLILHYNETTLTARAVESIRAMVGSKEIVIVDNCSPNGSGKDLLELYGGAAIDTDCPIHVILSKENGGFSKGNNVGYSYIKENIDTDFVVALNNDITFPQNDFIDSLTRVYEESNPRFYLAGPDIYTPHIRSHISPLAKAVRDTSQIEATIAINEDRIRQFSGKKSFASYTRYLQDKYQSSILLKLYNSIRRSQYDGATAHDTAVNDCVLNGACLIFDKRYIDKYDVLFEEHTFMYAEEDFLAYRLKKAGETARYCPELIADHVGQGTSGYGSMTYKQYCEKNIKSLNIVNEAYRKYIDYIK